MALIRAWYGRGRELYDFWMGGEAKGLINIIFEIKIQISSGRLSLKG